MRFRATLELAGKTATGIEVPAEVVAAVGEGRKRVPVRVQLGDHTYRTTVAAYSGRFYIPVNAEHRTAAGLTAGEEVDVDLVRDEAPREVTLPDDLAAALDADPEVRRRFDALAYTHRKEHVRAVEDAKKPETRARRIEAAVAKLRADG